jgi:hypothetical protein
MTWVPRTLRGRVAERARGRCEYCRFPEDCQPWSFEVDHIRPKSRGGRTVSQNLAWACPGCNAHKLDGTRAVDPHSGRSVALFHPRKQVWHDHFRWSRSNTVVIEGTTPTGRATVQRLQMNDPRIVRARKLVHRLGLLHESD